MWSTHSLTRLILKVKHLQTPVSTQQHTDIQRMESLLLANELGSQPGQKAGTCAWGGGNKKRKMKNTPKKPSAIKRANAKTVQFSMALLISHGLIPDGEQFLPHLPPSLITKEGASFYPTSLQHSFPSKQPGTQTQLAPIYISSRTKAGDNIGVAQHLHL